MSCPPVLAICNKQSHGDAWWRLVAPFNRLREAGVDAAICWLDETDMPTLPVSGRVVVLQRVIVRGSSAADMQAWTDRLRAAGALAVVFELDDDELTGANVEHMDAIEPLTTADRAELERQRQALLWTLQACDGATVSTEPLAEVVRRYTDKPVVVVENAIDVEWFRARLDPRPEWSEHLTIGWTGWRRPDADLVPMAEAWARIAKRYPEVRFVVGGHQPDILYAQDIPLDRFIWLPITGIDGYPRMMQVDIGCCAVADSPFSRCKCVHFGMRIATNRGVLEAGAIVPGMKVWRGGWRRVEAVRHDVPCPGIQIITTSGYRLKLTPDHRMLVNGAWKYAREIVQGDCMAMEREESTVRDLVRVNWPADSRMSRAGVSTRRVPGVLFDPDAFLTATDGPKLDITIRWGRFLGAWAGDGSCGQDTVAEIACDGQDQDWIDLLMDDLRAFGLNPSTEQHKMFDGTLLRRRGIKVASAHLLRVLVSLGVAIVRENGKPIRVPCVPDVIWRSPRPVIAEFIAGYFEADGTCSSSGIVATSKDEQLLRDLQRLLLLFGITSKLRQRTSTAQNGFLGHYWMLVMRRAESDVFAQEIGFRSARKRARLAEITSRTSSRAANPMLWEDVVTAVEPCMVTPVDIQVEGETYVLAGFVSHNSAIKSWEFALAGAVPVASWKVGIYDGNPSMKADTVDEWESWLAALIEDAPRRTWLAGWARAWVESHVSLTGRIGDWADAYREIAANVGVRT